MEKVKAFVTTNTTKKAVYLALAVPFCVVVGMIAVGKMAPDDFHRHLSEYTKWVLGTFVLSKAGLDGAGLIAGRGQ